MNKVVVVLAFVAGTACAESAGSGQPGMASAPAAGALAQVGARRYQECWDRFNARRWAEFSACYADGVESSERGGPTRRGKEAVVAGARAYAEAFPDAKGDPELVLVRDREVYASVLFHGKHAGTLHGPLGDIPATNKPVGYHLLHHVTLGENGLVEHEEWVFDVPTLLFQLGLSEGPARPPQTSPSPGAPTVVVADGNARERENAAAVRRAYELFSKKDPAFDQYLADGVIESNNSEPEDSVGKAALQAHNRAFVAGFPDISVSIESVLAAGDYTAQLGRIRGTNSGDMPGIGRTGRKVDVTFVELMRWENGKCVRSWPFMNGLELATQLGLVPSSEAPK